MDLNLFYSQHQIALIKAGAAASGPERARHLDHASGLACRISTYQHTHGAAAGASWRKPVLIAEGAAL
jgi:hypothetical protein